MTVLYATRKIFLKLLNILKQTHIKDLKGNKNTCFVAPSVRKVPQLYSRAASDIASQLYLGYAQVIFASRVFGANILSLKRQVSISLCVITQNITANDSLQYHFTCRERYSLFSASTMKRLLKL